MTTIITILITAIITIFIAITITIIVLAKKEEGSLETGLGDQEECYQSWTPHSVLSSCCEFRADLFHQYHTVCLGHRSGRRIGLMLFSLRSSLQALDICAGHVCQDECSPYVSTAFALSEPVPSFC
jgi:hypothetical protein